MFGTHAATSIEIEAERRREVIAATMRAGQTGWAERREGFGLVLRRLTPVVAALVAVLGPRPH